MLVAQNMNWKIFRESTQSKWQDSEVYSNVHGYQIQPGTKWNSGLTNFELSSFESMIGFKLPYPYKDMLSEINGFDRDSVNVHGSEEPEEYLRNCYKYPDDIDKVKWLLDEVEESKEYVIEALKKSGCAGKNIEGFLPLYGHRVLVVLEDKQLSPVISIVGDDVIVYGSALEEYWNNEFKL